MAECYLFVGMTQAFKDEFYDVIRESLGYNRKNLGLATHEAIQDWMNKKRQEKEEKIELKNKVK